MASGTKSCPKVLYRPHGPQNSGGLANSKVVFVLGGPGSGKGTQCASIAQEFGFMHISTGDLLRNEVTKGGDMAQQISAIMESGGLVPDDIVLGLLKDVMTSNASTVRGFLLDGYPRSVTQAQILEQQVVKPSTVLYLDVTDKEMMNRMMGRAATSGRADDNPETMQKRLVTFHEISQPVIDYYSKQGKVTRINANGTKEQTYNSIRGKFAP